MRWAVGKRSDVAGPEIIGVVDGTDVLSGPELALYCRVNDGADRDAAMALENRFRPALSDGDLRR